MLYLNPKDIQKESISNALSKMPPLSEVKLLLPEEIKVANSPDGLNPEQREAVENKSNALITVSSAGSGKTRILTEKVVNIIGKRGIDPSRIVMLTFTNKAAEEMRERIGKLIGDIDVANMLTCGTFHSWGHSILRRYHKTFSLHKNFTIWTERDSFEIWRTLYGKGYGDSKAVKIEAKFYYNIYSQHRNLGKSIEDIIKYKRPDQTHKEFIEMLKKTNRLIEGYTEIKERFQAVDFDDLLSLIENKLQTDKKFRQSLAQKYDYILVDEFQDSNSLQVNMLKYLIQGSKENVELGKSKNRISIFVCGDEAQSIYAFRGADFKQMMMFPEEFDSEVIILNTNYRSTQQILDLANQTGDCFTTTRWKKQMVGLKQGLKPYYIRCPDMDTEYEYIATLIKDMVTNRGFKGREIAILCRTNQLAYNVETALVKKDISYVKKGGISFFDKGHIQDILAFLKASFFHSDPVSWYRMLKLHPHIGSAKTNHIFGMWEKRVNSKENQFNLLKLNEHKFKNVDLKNLGNLLEEVSSLNQNPYKALELITEYYETNLPKLMTKGGRVYKKVIEDFDRLKELAATSVSVKNLLTSISLNDSDDAEKESKKAKAQGGNVVISTIHGFKGLEKDTIFISGCVEGLLPSKMSIQNPNMLLSDKEYEDHDAYIKAAINASVDEERRLFYVACTRARHNLIIMGQLDKEDYDQYLRTGKMPMSLIGSRFMSEIEPSSYTEILPVLPSKGLRKILTEYE